MARRLQQGTEPSPVVCGVLCRRTDGRIPLKDLIRFKERQWFVEELEVRTLLGKGACWVGCTA